MTGAIPASGVAQLTDVRYPLLAHLVYLDLVIDEGATLDGVGFYELLIAVRRFGVARLGCPGTKKIMFGE